MFLLHGRYKGYFQTGASKQECKQSNEILSNPCTTVDVNYVRVHPMFSNPPFQ